MNETEHSNSKLAYEYTESLLKRVDRGIDSVSRKVTAIFVSTGVLLYFASDLPDSNLLLVTLKIGIFYLLMVAVILCFIALKSKATGDVVCPSELLETDWFYEEEDRYRLFVARQWVEAIEQLGKEYSRKAKYLDYCLTCITVAFVLSVVSIILSL